MVTDIKNEHDYKVIMGRIDELMAKGGKNVSKEELAEIKEMALAAQQYEQNKYTIAMPQTLAGMIEMRMYEMRLKQKDLAKKLNITMPNFR